MLWKSFESEELGVKGRKLQTETLCQQAMTFTERTNGSACEYAAYARRLTQGWSGWSRAYFRRKQKDAMDEL